MLSFICIYCIALVLLPLATYGWWLRLEEQVRANCVLDTSLAFRIKFKFGLIIYLILLQHLGMDFPLGNVTIHIAEPKLSHTQLIGSDSKFSRCPWQKRLLTSSPRISDHGKPVYLYHTEHDIRGNCHV